MKIQHKINCIIEFADEKYLIHTKRCAKTNFINFGDLVKYFKVPRLTLGKEFKKKCGYGTLLNSNFICIDHLDLIDIPNNEDAAAFIKVLKEVVSPYLDELPSF